jgi:predicted nucleic acid-binding protein
MRFVLDTSILIDYLHSDKGEAADALVVASRHGSILVSLISLMELYCNQTKSNDEISQEVESIQALKDAYGVRVVPCTETVQKQALEILRVFRSPLGRNALPDALIIGTGIAYRGWLVTFDKRWTNIAQQNQRRQLLDIRIRVLSPVELVQRFG